MHFTDCHNAHTHSQFAMLHALKLCIAVRRQLVHTVNHSARKFAILFQICVSRSLILLKKIRLIFKLYSHTKTNSIDCNL